MLKVIHAKTGRPIFPITKREQEIIEEGKNKIAALTEMAMVFIADHHEDEETLKLLLLDVQLQWIEAAEKLNKTLHVLNNCHIDATKGRMPVQFTSDAIEKAIHMVLDSKNQNITDAEFIEITKDT